MLSIASNENVIEWKHITVMTTLSKGSILKTSSYKNASEEKDNLIAIDESEMMHSTVAKSTMTRLVRWMRYVNLC